MCPTKCLAVTSPASFATAKFRPKASAFYPTRMQAEHASAEQSGLALRSVTLLTDSGNDSQPENPAIRRETRATEALKPDKWAWVSRHSGWALGSIHGRLPGTFTSPFLFYLLLCCRRLPLQLHAFCLRGDSCCGLKKTLAISSPPLSIASSTWLRCPTSNPSRLDMETRVPSMSSSPRYSQW